MPDEGLEFEAFCRQVEQDRSLVRCVRCGKVIPAAAARCPECGVHFDGEASDFVHAEARAEKRRRKARITAVVAVVLIILIVLSIFHRSALRELWRVG